MLKRLFFAWRYIFQNRSKRGSAMRILVSIDDTDNLDSRGTGEIASLIAEALQEKGWGTASMVTRHQLLVHPDIPYTSHNSSMCFVAEIGEECLDRVIAFAGDFLDHECAEGSDPGLCVAVLDRIGPAPELIAFGQGEAGGHHHAAALRTGGPARGASVGARRYRAGGDRRAGGRGTPPVGLRRPHEGEP
jgi:hypothetical protein